MLPWERNKKCYTTFETTDWLRRLQRNQKKRPATDYGSATPSKITALFSSIFLFNGECKYVTILRRNGILKHLRSSFAWLGKYLFYSPGHFTLNSKIMNFESLLSRAYSQFSSYVCVSKLDILHHQNYGWNENLVENPSKQNFILRIRDFRKKT